ncbi:hypothetical protein PIB30_092195 [Stylosanthes scabra]|uniref:Uncharacterized protein n=1 Tax=Stylosanthes scabra TaxID=79078 RepID=A0ABU6RUQ7_9FABA|nr:hypothetical protein [Stylosanthes scabra]
MEFLPADDRYHLNNNSVEGVPVGEPSAQPHEPTKAHVCCEELIRCIKEFTGAVKEITARLLIAPRESPQMDSIKLDAVCEGLGRVEKMTSAILE